MKTTHFSGFDRRRFIQTIGASALAGFPALGVEGANDKVRLGLIGCGGKGEAHLAYFSGLKNVEFVAISDADTAHMAKGVKKLESQGQKTPVGQHQDYRDLLDRQDIDAVVIASPNHWHALHCIHACQAGKDVYVEKPVTHKMSESAPMIAAAEKYDRIVQAGTQNRSDTGLIDALDFIQSGEIGKITAVRGLCYRNRDSIGRAKNPPLKPPSTVDYNLWLGPALDLPLLRKRFHYDWHWIWNTGNGDIGNQAPHELDIISWFLGDPGLPAQMNSFGQRFVWDDAGQSPNMQTLWFELGDVPVIFELNDLWIKPGTNAAPSYKGTRVGMIVTCEGGEFRGGRGGGNIFSLDGKNKIQKFPGDAGNGHAQNFIDAVRSRNSDGLHGKLARSTQTAALSHLANLSHRSGSPATGKELREGALASSPDLLEVLDRQEAQLDRWSVDTSKTPYILGSDVTVDPSTGKLSGELANSPLANPQYRKGFTLPEKA
ncbi:Gfo/Idh/MocA family protein [Haloferula sp.]|uniref:Gfo/Idh/MocA family protein n=1 Tax=Haloferula sp. TaxID=2497595 RepID=UPI003C77D6C8